MEFSALLKDTMTHGRGNQTLGSSDQRSAALPLHHGHPNTHTELANHQEERPSLTVEFCLETWSHFSKVLLSLFCNPAALNFFH